MKKTKVIVLLIVIIINILSLNVFAQETVDVYVNGEYLETDQPAIIYQDRTMVPLRAITEKLGCDVDWDNYTSTALISNPATVVATQIDNYYITKMDRGENEGKSRSIAIDVPPIIYNGRTLVPARAIAEALNAKVEWNGNANRVDITLEYDFIADYNEAGYAEVILWDAGDGPYHAHGFIDKKRNLVLPLQYEGIGDFCDGLAKIQDYPYYGFINEKLEFVVPIQYQGAGDFSEGLAPVQRVADDGIRSAWGFINTKGKEVIKCEYLSADGFTDGLACVQMFGSGKFCYIDKKGNIAIEGPFDFALPFSNGIARVRKDGKYGYIDTKGTPVTGFEFDSAYDFADGLAPVSKNVDGKYWHGYVNEKGEIAIPLIYDNAWEFTEGLAPVMKNWKWGFIDTNGDVVIPFQYDNIGGWSPLRGGLAKSGFQGGKAMVIINDEAFFIDKQGNILP